jgi:hypothetical protein
MSLDKKRSRVTRRFNFYLSDTCSQNKNC